ncbi:Cell wall hydrolase/autolysin [Candidatus Sulfotelmatobacter sp. SbA7]|nr:Cell wall hydrolase/autolysin [Candidatus Sulfotelmatobacter sp. SbA7]
MNTTAGGIVSTEGRGRMRVAMAVLLAIASVVLLSGSSEEKRVSIYSTIANYSLPVLERNRLDYVGLLEVLEPLGTVSGRVNADHWRLRYNDADAEFTAGKRVARTRGTDFYLSANFILEGGRGLVPLADLSSLLSRVLGGPVTFNPSARRLFVGSVAIHFTAQISNVAPPKLIMNFSGPVNPSIATEPGKLRMTFSHDPVVAPGSPKLTFNSTAITSASFLESNGEAEVVISSTVPVLASFSNNGRTITVGPPPTAAATPATAAPALQPPALAPVPVAAGPASVGNAPVAAAAPYFAVVDASHGGEERGAALTEQLAEKDVTLAFARLLRQELDNRGLRTLLLRDADTTLTLDQRAAMTNSASPAIYLSVHAASQGTGVRLYTGLTASGGENIGAFVDWDTAQAPFQALSDAAATSVAAALHGKQVAVRTLTAPLRPLNNIATAAVAIEIAPPASDVAKLNSAAYQQPIAAAVAAGVADARDRLQAARK